MLEPLLSAPLVGPEAPSLDLVAFPGAGAGAAGFRGWRGLLPPDWRLTLVTLPGREASYGQPFATDMDRLADAIAAALRARRADGPAVPLVLFGYSMGGLLAMLVADRMPSDALVVAACAPPAARGRAEHEGPPDEESLKAEVAAVLRAVGPTDEGPLEAGLLDELVELSVPVLAADIALLETFKAPSRPLGCGVWALYGADDLLDPVPWSAETTSTAGHSVLPGSHFFVQDSPVQVIDELRCRVQQLIGGQG